MNLHDDSGIQLGASLASSADWPALLATGSRQDFAAAWLAWLWPRLPAPERAVVMVDDGAGTLNTVATLPQGGSLDHLRPWITESAGSGQALARPDPGRAGTPWVAVLPAVVSGRVRVLVCVELGALSAAEWAAARGVVEWGLGWLVSLLFNGEQGHADRHLQRSRQLFDLTLVTLAQPGFAPAALAVVNGLAKRYKASLGQLGWLERHSIVLKARSNTAWHDARSGLVLLAEQAMNEALDLRRNLQCVATDGAGAQSGPLGYVREAGTAAVAIVLLHEQEHVVGAFMLERDHAFTADELESMDAQAVLLGPLLALKMTAQRGLWAHLRDAWTSGLRIVTDTSHPGPKLLAGAVLAGVVVSALLPVTYRVTAPSVIEGEVQRVAVAPFQGFIQSAEVRAGDSVKRGQVLARLDDRELQLEKVRWDADLQLALRREREALASGNRVDQRLAAAQADQATAQLELTLDRLQRVQIVAPFDGVVLRGDLSQQLGAPVEPGKVLFELAPLDAWRVVLKVDERDMAHVRAGQVGELVLASLPGTTYPLTVKSVTSVAVAEAGRNHFRVEAELTQESAQLRPAMEGVAKLQTDERSLMWVWTHRLVDWLRLTAWEWLP